MKTDMSIANFEDLLDTFGSDRTRWPIEDRAAAARLLAGSAEARALLREAEALDGLLAKAPQVAPARQGLLADRILAAAQKTPRLAVSQSSAGELSRRGAAAPRHMGRLRVGSFGIGALVTAASLMLGILIGLSGTPQSVLRPVQQLTGLPLMGAQATQNGGLDSLDEDLL